MNTIIILLAHTVFFPLSLGYVILCVHVLLLCEMSDADQFACLFDLYE